MLKGDRLKPVSKCHFFSLSLPLLTPRPAPPCSTLHVCVCVCVCDSNAIFFLPDWCEMVQGLGILSLSFRFACVWANGRHYNSGESPPRGERRKRRPLIADPCRDKSGDIFTANRIGSQNACSIMSSLSNRESVNSKPQPPPGNLGRWDRSPAHLTRHFSAISPFPYLTDLTPFLIQTGRNGPHNSNINDTAAKHAAHDSIFFLRIENRFSLVSI